MSTKLYLLGQKAKKINTRPIILVGTIVVEKY